MTLKSHWRHTMVDGAKFWITCKWLKLLRKAGRLQIQRHLQSCGVNVTSELKVFGEFLNACATETYEKAGSF